jgi:hypothetical protein
VNLRLRERLIPFSASATRERFGTLTKAVLPDGYTDRAAKPKDFYGIKNKDTKEVFAFYYDPVRGVGQKFNCSWGFQECILPATIKLHLHRVPCYDFYKVCFSDCDNFNLGLDGKRWPFKRGGKGLHGMVGAHNDFAMMALWQNIYNAFYAIKKGPLVAAIDVPGFDIFLCDLADAIYKYSTDEDNFRADVPETPSPPASPGAPRAPPPPLQPRASLSDAAAILQKRPGTGSARAPRGPGGFVRVSLGVFLVAHLLVPVPLIQKKRLGVEK